jgi:hypothetical protein
MRTVDDLLLRLALGILVGLLVIQILVGCEAPEASRLGLSAPAFPEVDLSLHRRTPEPEQPPAFQARDPRASWCEPLDQPFCETTSDCTDGARCVTPWWAAEATDVRVCARPMPTRSERRWRSSRLRVYVDHVCNRADGCEPDDIHALFRVLALRESTWRPWKRHRLSVDLDAARAAWELHRDTYASNPAVADPDRWTSVGLLGQNPAIWLRHWDTDAPPEVLCGEVEGPEVFRRVAIEAVRKIADGVQCDGETFTGTAKGGGPSWYDVSRVNSGRLCPGSGEHRDAFAARARRVGLDPWAPVSVADLGEPIPRDRQDEIAAEIRAKMDAVPR